MVMLATQAIYPDRASGTTFSHWEVCASAADVLSANIFMFCSIAFSIAILGKTEQ